MDEKELSGSCLCGAVHYRVRGPWLRFIHCHCMRCRKATGSAHATNLYVQADQFRWTEGEAVVRRYDLPTAERFSTSFCSKCGSRVPSLSRDAATVSIPAGSLDESPDIMPQAQIYWGSRAPWSCDAAAPPKFEAGRPR